MMMLRLRVSFGKQPLGAALIVVYEHFQNAEASHLKPFARILAPREAVGRATGINGENHD